MCKCTQINDMTEEMSNNHTHTYTYEKGENKVKK